MEAVGSQLFVIIIIPILFISYIIYSYRGLFIQWYRKIVNRQYDHPRAPQAPRRPQFGQGQCSICLTQKQLQVSATCGHSFCGACIRDIYQRSNTQIDCPLCRRQITTVFRNFPAEVDHPDSQKVIEFILQYNFRFHDERSWLRRVRQFPYVFRMVRRGIFNPRFLIFFIRSAFFFRFFFFFIFYLIVPLDIIPQNVFGFVGLLDDIFVTILILVFMISLAAVHYMRMREG